MYCKLITSSYNIKGKHCHQAVKTVSICIHACNIICTHIIIIHSTRQSTLEGCHFQTHFRTLFSKCNGEFKTYSSESDDIRLVSVYAAAKTTIKLIKCLKSPLDIYRWAAWRRFCFAYGTMISLRLWRPRRRRGVGRNTDCRHLRSPSNSLGCSVCVRSEQEIRPSALTESDL